MVLDVELSTGAFAGKFVCDHNVGTHDLQNHSPFLTIFGRCDRDL